MISVSTNSTSSSTPPGVGEHLQDHPEGVIGFETKKPMTQESTQWWEAGIFTTVDDDLDRPDLMMHYGSVPFDMHTLRQGTRPVRTPSASPPNVTHARSRGGTVKLRSRDFRDKPRVDPRYFTTPEGYDMRIMTAGLRKHARSLPPRHCGNGLRANSIRDPTPPATTR